MKYGVNEKEIEYDIFFKLHKFIFVLVEICINHWLDQDPVVRPLVEQDSQSLQRLLPEIPLWVKSPDYERVCN